MTKCLLFVLILANFASVSFASRSKGQASFEGSKNFYSSLVARGANAAERVGALDRIITKFKANKHMLQLKYYKAEREYLRSYLYYELKKNAGVSQNEQIYILGTILNKYRFHGIDLTLAKTEYDLLTAPKLKVELTPQPTTQPPIVTLPLIEPATQQAIIEPRPQPEPDPQVTKLKRSKYVGFALCGLGTYGLYGYEAITNLNDIVSLSYGQGSGLILSNLPNPSSSLTQNSQSILIRYGKTVYFATGMNQVSVNGTVVSGTARSSGSVNSTAVPLIVGLETGNKRGIFFGMQWSFMNYYGDSERTLSATDPLTNNIEKLKLSPPNGNLSIGISVGFYLF